MQSQPKPRKKSGGIVNFLLLGVGLGFLAWTLSSNRQVLADVFSRPIQYPYLLLGFAFVTVAAVISFVRWYALVRMLGVSFRLMDSLRLSFVGAFFNLVIPGAVGGDLVKAAYLARMNLPKTQAITTLLVDRIVGLLGLFLLASIAALAGWSGLSPSVKNLGYFAMAMTLAGWVALAVILLDLPPKLLPGLAKSEGRIGILIRELSTLSKSYRSRWQGLVATVFVSAGCHALTSIAFYLVGVSLFPNFQVGLGKHLLIFPLVLFSTAVPLPFGALGFSEKVSDQLFELANHPSGAVAMMGYRVLMYAFGLLSMLVYLWNIQSIRDLTRQAEQMEGSVVI
jgi:uncharacterized membrane protein YbhN (UPF0104 family)